MVSLEISNVLSWIEVLSIALYILAASDRMFKSNEAGMKYFLMGSLHLESFFGICLIYGAMGV
jgi:NADH:ubiquinone oxidoreductase subunit 2 (subunit N)